MNILLNKEVIKKYNIINRFLKSEQIVQYHFKNDFPIFSILLFQTRLLHFISTCLVLTQQNDTTMFVFGIISLLHSLVIILGGLINIYIIHYCNPITTEVFMQMAKVIASIAFGGFTFHQASTLTIMPPNIITNYYHINSPTGRGYGLHSSGQGILIDGIKTSMGSEFNVNEVLDEKKMVDPTKLATYIKSHKRDIRNNLVVNPIL